MMDRTVSRKVTLKEADEALCLSMDANECLAVLAELNRIGIEALGLHDEPLRRREARKYSFRDFVALASRPGF